MSRRSLECVVIGGGAAGFFGAIACAEANPHAYVTLLEAGREPLTKVRISGGGRCNVTHACFDAATLVQHYPRGGKALRGAFTRFQPNDTIRWFAEHDVRLHTEADGRMFPTTNDSATIVDCLTDAARQAGVEIQTSRPVVAVRALNEGFAIELKTGATLTCDRLLLATGSNPQGHRLAQGLGHQIEPPVPSLFTFNIADPQLHELAGVSVESAHLRLQLSEGKPLEQTGALLITHWGLSGPAVLKLSAWGARSLHAHRYRGTLWVNWLPNRSADQIHQVLSETKTQHGKKAIATFNPLPLPRRLWHYLGERTAIAPETRWADLSKASLNQLAQQISQSSFAIAGKSTFKDEFVTCGGIRLKEIDFKTMQSRCCPHLYCAGEILDIDGVTGGFNFQSAWTTGWIAGQSMGAVTLGAAIAGASPGGSQ